MGEIAEIFICREKKSPRENIQAARLKADFGLVGDAYSETGGKKQVTLLGEEDRNSLKKEPVEGLCFKRFLETIRFRGVEAESLKPGTRISAGESILEISLPMKKCYPECPIVQEGRRCALSTGVRFCRVARSGTVKKGDSFSVIEP